LAECLKGDLFIGEKQVNGLPPGNREIAWVSAEGALFEQRTVDANLTFGLKLCNVPKPETERRVKEAVAILGLGELLGKKVSGLSGVDRLRVALGRAMVRQPKIFLLDAPLCGLDAIAQGQMRAELIRLHERLQATMLYATADPMEALALGNRIVAIKDGVVQQVGTPAEIYGKPANLFVAGFFGAPPRNLIHGSLKRVGEGLQFREQGEGSIECKLGELSNSSGVGEYAGKEVVLGIRPEHIRPVLREEPAKTRIKGLADHLEPRGAETLIYFQTGAHCLISRSDSFLDRSEAGHRMQFELDLA
jgi:multiple sugar transport system ATP-binding protein